MPNRPSGFVLDEQSVLEAFFRNLAVFKKRIRLNPSESALLSFTDKASISPPTMANLDTTSTPQSKANPHSVRILQTSHSPRCSATSPATVPPATDNSLQPHTRPSNNIEQENPAIDSPEKRNNPTDKVPTKPTNHKEKMEQED